jgi:hypothetical protein
MLAKFVLVPRWLIRMSPLISAFRNGAKPACAAPVFGFTYSPLAPVAAIATTQPRSALLP